jgi:ribosome maturation factor RimP
VSLDDAAEISRQLSAVLDEATVMGDFPYTLEVSSPGVDRPLTEPRHWRRAAGRLVEAVLADGSTVTGRIAAVDSDEVVIDRGDDDRRLAMAQVRRAHVVVEFGRGGPGATSVAAAADGPEA